MTSHSERFGHFQLALASEAAGPVKAAERSPGLNGSGKSNLYRALRLLADTAQGRVVPSLAREGGLQSTLWAGPEAISRSMKRGEHPVQGTRRKQTVNLRVGFASSDFGYLIDLGLPTPGISAFGIDPEIKQECIWHGPTFRPSTLLVDRQGPMVRVRNEDGSWHLVRENLRTFDSMMTQSPIPGMHRKWWSCANPSGHGASTTTFELTRMHPRARRKLARALRSWRTMGPTLPPRSNHS